MRGGRRRLGGFPVVVPLIAAWGMGAAELGTAQGSVTQLESVSISLAEGLNRGQPVAIGLGPLFPDEPIRVVLRVVNDTDQTMAIAAAEADCQCTAVAFDRTAVPPESAGVVTVDFDMRGRDGVWSGPLAFQLTQSRGEHLAHLMVPVTLDLRRDVALSRREVVLAYRPDALAPVGAVRSPPIQVQLDEEMRARGPAAVEISPLVALPEGLRVETAGNAGGLRDSVFRLAADTTHLESLSREFTVPLGIQVLDASGELLADVRRSLDVAVQAGVHLRTDPPDTFLGILMPGDFPRRQTVTVSLEPAIPFRLRETAGRDENLTWTARPADAAQDLCEAWVVDVTVEAPAGIGGHLHRVPLDLVCRDETGEWEQRLELEIHCIALR